MANLKKIFTKKLSDLGGMPCLSLSQEITGQKLLPGQRVSVYRKNNKIIIDLSVPEEKEKKD